MAASFGINLGATNASVAVFRDGKADVVANEAGDRVTPALVAFTDHDITVGLPAKQGLIRNAKNTVGCVKQVIGHKYSDPEISDISKFSTAKIVDRNGMAEYQVEYKEKNMVTSPEDVTVHIFKNLLGIAERQGLENESHDAVLTVPVHFDEKKKALLRNTANKAGFNILRLITEPCSAALAYDVGQAKNEEDCTVLVYRLGHQNCDASVIEVKSGMYQLISSVTSKDAAGKHISEALVNYFASEFKRQWKLDCKENKRSIAKLRNAAETCKHILSTLPTSQVSVDSLFEGVDFTANVSRGRFEGLCGGIMNSCLQPLKEALSQAKLSETDVNKVILCGGSTRIPFLQSQITSLFPTAEILNSIPPDEVVAIGAAKQAGILAGSDIEEMRKNEEANLLNCTAADIKIKGGNGDFLTVLSRHTPIPMRKSHVFNLAANQTSFTLPLYSCLDDAQDLLCKITLRDVPSESQINLSVHAKGDGSLHVTCTEPSSGKSESITIEGS